MFGDINKEIERVINQFQKRYGDCFTINSNGIMTKQSESEYNEKYKCNNAFQLDVNDIISAIYVIPLLYTQNRSKTTNSYTIKHKIERNDKYIELKGHCYLSNGDLIIAMLIMGYKYRYNKGKRAITNPNVDFYVAASDQMRQKKGLIWHRDVDYEICRQKYIEKILQCELRRLIHILKL